VKPARRSPRLVLASACFIFGACGEAAPPEVGHVDAELRLRAGVGTVNALDLFLLAGHTTSGAPLGCIALAKMSPATRADLLVRAHRLLPPGDAKLPGLQAEASLILAVDAYANADGTGARAGYGCQDGIAIQAEQTTRATVMIDPLP
jgi:hypothetical protein